MSRVAADPEQCGGALIDQPGNAEEVEAGHLGHAADMARDTLRVEDRQVDPAEVEPVAARPDHGRYAFGREIELGDLRRMEAEKLAVVRRGVDPGSLDVGVSATTPLIVYEAVRGKTARVHVMDTC